MFSRFLLSTRALLLLSQRSSTTVSTLNDETTGVQLQAELAEAALEGMVTTRRQSQLFSDADQRDGSEIDTPWAQAKKRKIGNNPDAIDASPRDSLAKRRRKSSASGTTSMDTPVKANRAGNSNSAVLDLGKASDGTLESDSHERNGRKRKSAANGNKRSVEQGCDTRAPRAGASASPTTYVGNGTQNLRQTVAVVIEGRRVDNESQEDDSSNKQSISGKKGRRSKDLPVHITATAGAVDDANKTSTTPLREGHKNFTADEVNTPAAEYPKDRVSSPTQVLKKPAQTGRGSFGPFETRQKGIASSGRKSNPGGHENNVGSTRVSDGEDGASVMELPAGGPKATHKRFASEEPEPPPVQLPNAQEHSEARSEGSDDDGNGNVIDDDSDNDAPEILTASAGLKQVRATAIEAARAVELQEAITKEQRKARDTKLKEQAKTANRRKSNHWEALTENELDNVSELSKGTVPSQQNASTYPKFTSKGPLPALLPDEILAIEPAAHRPSPPIDPEARLVSVPKKRKFFDADPKPPKDVKRGPVNVRVLEVHRQLLPPRASKTSKALKEAWLAGRRGPGGAGLVQRRKLGGGFVRK